jgi:peptidoglycan/xylan/chitin deacetylase (PgdA/CDA1 family)
MTEEQIVYVKRFIASTNKVHENPLSLDLIERIFCSLVNINNHMSASVIDPIKQEYATPWIDQELHALTLRDLSTQHYANESVWPENKPFALCLTHDVDFVSGIDHYKKFFRRMRRAFNASGPKSIPLYQSAGSLYRLATGIGSQDPLANYDKWMKLEDTYGFKSTFNFFSFPTSKESVYDCDYKFNDTVIFDGTTMSVDGMIKQIDKAGWEIGLHGSINSYNDARLLKVQKQSLEDIIQKEVVSTRNHYLKIDTNITPRIQAEVGLRNDSTLGYNNVVGFRTGTSFPYWCWDIETSNSLPLLEIPMSLMDVALFHKCTTRKDFDSAIEKCIKVMDEVEIVGGCLTLNWHPNYLINDYYWQAYSILLQEAFRRNAWGCTAKEVSEYWKFLDQNIDSKKP